MSIWPKIWKPFENGILSKPCDSLVAKITQSGLQILKLNTSETKRTFVRYPSTGTIIETIIHKNK